MRVKVMYSRPHEDHDSTELDLICLDFGRRHMQTTFSLTLSVWSMKIVWINYRNAHYKSNLNASCILNSYFMPAQRHAFKIFNYRFYYRNLIRLTTIFCS